MVKLQYPGIDNYWMQQYLFQNLKDARHIVNNKKQSLIIVNDGKTGLGKTTLSFQQAFFFAKGDKTKFNLSHVLYDPLPAFEKVTNSKKGDVWVFDESVLFNSRSAMSQYNKAMIMLLSTIRSKQIFIILNIPSFFDLDRAITMDKCNLLVHLYGEHFGDRGKFMVFDDRRMKDLFIYGKKTYTYSGVKANFLGNFGSKFLLDEKQYDAKKNLELKKMMSKTSQPITQARLQRDFFMSYLNQKYRVSYKEMISILPDEATLSLSTISDAVIKTKKKYNPEWFRKRLIVEDEVEEDEK